MNRRFTSLPNNFQLFYVFPTDGFPRVLQQHQRDRYGEKKDERKEEVTEEAKALYHFAGQNRPRGEKRLGKREDRWNTQYSIS